ncbi:LysR family transcriptional regulator [Tissierella carlieri]|uniref:LysR family transcriptional regulator n=1 Tax=Tissierella carlieri TaxID=689904 RepID=A0ABT1SI12_9FIRM|nr:LysR family transcriptional regulator [Tissierella carlieri]MBU5312575.1 LysR family transcriptional regulator [Tissierella carlieri]MCQ4925592.1 LysR family transcriptional regulator [Tissierella carlieri]
MDLKQLLYFVTVVNEGNITAAARKLHIAQPALSNHIKNLEDDLDMKLFHRGPRKITLTDAGEILYTKANNILELKHSIRRELEDNRSGFKGTLKIGTISAIDADLLENNFLKFHQKYNNIKYELYEGITPEIIEMLFSRVIEIGIVRTPFDKTGLNITYLKVEPMIAAYKNDDDLDKLGSNISIEHLNEKPLIIYRRFESIIISAFQKVEISPYIFCINDDSRTSLLWANAGLGVAIVPISSKNLVLANNLKFKVIDNESLFTQVAIITLENSSLSSVATNFLKEITIDPLSI